MRPHLVEAAADTSIEACAAELLAVLADRNSLAEAPRLFRGFALGEPGDLSSLLKLMDVLAAPYIGGNSPRTQLGENVYTSTEYSALSDITQHQELSYELRTPDVLFFLCGRPSETGGATPLTDAAAVLDKLDPELVAEFQARGLRYVQRLPAAGGVGKSWPEAFETSDRAACEFLLARLDLTYTWDDGDTLVLVRNRPALRRHSRTGTQLWFNQADQWHPSSLGPARKREALQRMYGDRLPHDVVFGDGTPIPDDAIAEISKVTRATAWAAPWQAGDLVVIDNQATMHGRDRYTGARSVFVAMATLGA